MNGILFFCQLVLVLYVSYSPCVRGAHIQPGQIYELEVALKKIYKHLNPFHLLSTEKYERRADHPQLKYNGGSSYTVLTNKNKRIDFTIKHIFVVLRNIIGIVAYPNNINILLKFTNEQNARDICLERYSFDKYSANDFEVDKVLAIDNTQNEGIRVNEILRKGAIEISKLESSVPFDEDDYYYRFTIHPTGNGPKPPVAMFVTNVLRVQPGPKSNFLVLAHEVGEGAFYFGLIFSSQGKMDTFLQALNAIKVRKGFGHSQMARNIIEKLFEKCK